MHPGYQQPPPPQPAYYPPPNPPSSNVSQQQSSEWIYSTCAVFKFLWYNYYVVIELAISIVHHIYKYRHTMNWVGVTTSLIYHEYYTANDTHRVLLHSVVCEPMRYWPKVHGVLSNHPVYMYAHSMDIYRCKNFDVNLQTLWLSQLHLNTWHWTDVKMCMKNWYEIWEIEWQSRWQFFSP